MHTLCCIWCAFFMRQVLQIAIKWWFMLFLQVFMFLCSKGSIFGLLCLWCAMWRACNPPVSPVSPVSSVSSVSPKFTYLEGWSHFASINSLPFKGKSKVFVQCGHTISHCPPYLCPNSCSSSLEVRTCKVSLENMQVASRLWFDVSYASLAVSKLRCFNLPKPLRTRKYTRRRC